MVRSFVEQRPAVDETLKNLWQELGVELTNQDWETLVKIERVLKPLEEATKMLSKFDASISLVIPFVTAIVKSLEDASEDRGVLTWKRALKKNMEKRFSEIEETKHYTVATMLDSRSAQYNFHRILFLYALFQLTMHAGTNTIYTEEPKLSKKRRTTLSTKYVSLSGVSRYFIFV